MIDFWARLLVFMLASFVGAGMIRRVSGLLRTPIMSIPNAMPAIAVVGAILVAGGDYASQIRTLWAIALVASITSVVCRCALVVSGQRSMAVAHPQLFARHAAAVLNSAG